MSEKIAVNIVFRGIDITVFGKYIPEESAVRYDSNMEGHPGYPEYFNIESIFIENTDVTDLLEEHLDEIEKLVLEQIDNE